ncbi:uncharacterized protein LOC123685747 [Harmonia axyridis]|uniref:uncharacterized protein LOC123685747 n=1 Tax=Harmonia axyridis TaxID=115357 RepID=UPI001E278FF0|nr:uncharacterized protein LOC123685747 [Harmonia axyridis]
MNDEELTKLAVAQLIAEGERFKRRHELQYRLDDTTPSRLKPNLRYFKNAIKNCVSSNDRNEKIRKSRAADELKYLDSKAKRMKREEKTEENTDKKEKNTDEKEKRKRSVEKKSKNSFKGDSSTRTHKDTMKNS